ncbi:MAG: superinfection immunity protein, partial [Opitutales bacterium]|nr:superinfection immunity protein [Opitutales bacterium]
MDVLFFLFCATLVALVYFLPAFIAFCRAHTFRWVIFMLNIFAF